MIRTDVLMVTNMWPHEANPAYGIFVRRQIESVEALGLRCEVMFVEGYRSRWEYVRAALTLCRLNFAPRRPLLVHGHGGETALIIRLYLRGPVMVSYCGDDLLGTPGADGLLTAASRLRSALLCAQARLLTATVTKSTEMAAVLPRRARQRNTVLPNGVDRDCPAPPAERGARGPRLAGR